MAVNARACAPLPAEHRRGASTRSDYVTYTAPAAALPHLEHILTSLVEKEVSEAAIISKSMLLWCTACARGWHTRCYRASMSSVCPPPPTCACACVCARACACITMCRLE
ncbi:MAG: hypothetical protein EOO65_00910 [Methanosarcinales archaeon]|nr:MAG: hypothetical protein EOO65_00910 [Methanosarcinales archaeon]